MATATTDPAPPGAGARSRPPGRVARAAAARRVDRVLREVFGLASLRPGQRAVIDAVLAGRDTLAVMPTGAGKSLCYQLPALLLPGTTLVVSPLLALMQDQLDKLTALGLSAVQVHGALAAGEVRRVRATLGRRSAEFVFTTPEQLAAGPLRHELAGAGVDLVVLDEAHCVSQWGHDFRPAYLEACAAIAALGDPTVLALTATAPPEVVDDLARTLGRGPLHLVHTGLHRPNLAYDVRPVAGDADKQRQVVAHLRADPGPCIVYAATIRHVETLAAVCRQDGLDVLSYHGRMRAADRRATQARFMSGEAPWIVATNAFGLGIDRADIRAVVHYDLPPSLEVYAQESGRAGRDGAPARGILLYQRADRRLQTFFMAGRYPSRDDFLAVAAALDRHAAVAAVPLADIAAAAGVSVAKARVVRQVLKEAGLVAERRGRRLTRRRPLAVEHLERLAEAYDARRARDRARLEQVIVYAQTALCRTRMLLEALGEAPSWTACGTCDNCRGAAVRAAGAAEGAA
jgi:ATP-dependent DNA helicase RecQ